jgi:hypothetical protein
MISGYNPIRLFKEDLNHAKKNGIQFMRAEETWASGSII